MSEYTIGSLFSGYGGLDIGVMGALGPGDTLFVSDVEKGPCAVLARRFPDAPNIGDITRVDWREIPRVDVLCGGSPCTDLSTAGARAGMTKDTRSGLWESMFRGVQELRPRLVVWENVLGATSARAFSLLEQRDGRVGEEVDGPVLRALGRVLGDLASIGYDAQWGVVPACAVGAPHKRARVFLIAHPHGQPWQQWRQPAAGETPSGRSRAGTGGSDRAHVKNGSPHMGVELMPTPVAQPSGNSPEIHLGKKPGRRRVTDRSIIVENNLMGTGGALLPTPQATVSTYSSSGYGPNLNEVAVSLLPTSKASNGDYGLPRTSGRPPSKSTHLATRLEYTDYGLYAGAVRRWEVVTGRLAPSPTEPPAREGGRPRLSARFVEWMMGLPDGWVTSPDIGLSRSVALRALGNGVVPQQALSAIVGLLERERRIGVSEGWIEFLS